MTFTDEQTKALQAPLSKSRVSTRKGGGGTELSYLKSWDVIDTANKIFGFDGWGSDTLEVSETLPLFSEKRQNKRDNSEYDFWKVAYMARVRVSAGGTSHVGVGFGSGQSSDMFGAIELAIKEAETDAQKRALKNFGNQFGLALYDKDQTNVEDTSKRYAAQGFVADVLKEIEGAATRDAVADILKRHDAKIARVKSGYPSIYEDFDRIISDFNERLAA